MTIEIPKVPIQKVELHALKNSSIDLFILREDLNHQEIQGNKFRKLKYNLIRANKENKKTILTFGGAYSNHIAATAAAGKLYGFKTVGIIRGEELANQALNPSLKKAQAGGMHLHFISRANYKERYDPVFIQEIRNEFGDAYILPEGGTNELAVKGCEEILNTETNDFDYICVPIGTGGTFAGIVNTALPHQKVLGFPVMSNSIEEQARIGTLTNQFNYEFIKADMPLGFGKINDELLSFVRTFYTETNILLDPLYTSRMLYDLVRKIKKSSFKEDSKILAVHTGGLQSWKGINQQLQQKGKQPIL